MSVGEGTLDQYAIVLFCQRAYRKIFIVTVKW